MNSVNLIGTLGQDPEVTYFESGSVKCKFSLAHEEYKKDTDNVTHWLPCEAWGKTAETISNYVKKGHKVGVTGQLLSSSWDDKDGNKRKSYFVKVDRITLVERKPKNDNTPDF